MAVIQIISGVTSQRDEPAACALCGGDYDWMAYMHDIAGFEYRDLSRWAEEYRQADQRSPSDGSWIAVKDDMLETDGPYHRLFSNGDGYLAYPNDNDQPINSLRFEALRDGLEENELHWQPQTQRDRLTDEDGALADALLANGDGVAINHHIFTDQPAELILRRVQLPDRLDRAVTNNL